MDKAFNFVRSLDESFFDLMGYPTVEIYSECVEVSFNCKVVIETLDIFKGLEYDSIRMFGDHDCLAIIFIFNRDED